MKLACNISKFNCGIDTAIDLIAKYNLNALEMNLAPFKTTATDKFTTSEQNYFKQIRDKAFAYDLKFSSVNLDSCLTDFKKSSYDNEIKMFKKLTNVANILACNKIGIYINPSNSSDWKEIIISHLNILNDIALQQGIKLLLRLSTPVNYRKSSLFNWKVIDTLDWRDLIANVPGLSLSFSPADCIWLGINYLDILPGIVSAIENIEAHDIEINRTILSDNGLFGPLWWQYRMPGKGLVDWRQLIEALKLYEYKENITIQFEDDFIEDSDTEFENSLHNSVKFLKPLVK